MLRKTLTILSLIGLLLSVGLWVASCGRTYHYWLSDATKSSLLLHDGVVAVAMTETKRPSPPSLEFIVSPRFEETWVAVLIALEDRRASRWLPSKNGLTRDPTIYHMPLPFAVLLFGSLLLFLYAPDQVRRHKRRKLGLCVNCGYDLRASKERCPECGQGF